MRIKKEHITVCICTYKRPELLKRLLDNIAIQETGNYFEISLSIVDNDVESSAKPVVENFRINSDIEIIYAHMPERNLALLRNLSVLNSKGDYVAFIDDDEYPTKRWLLLLYESIHRFQASGALGPVLPKYQAEPPDWVEKGKFCERARHQTGASLQWRHTRTGNALLKRHIFLDPNHLFDPKFSLGGEDDTLFERLINEGHLFVWCDEAVVFEEIPAERLTVSYFLKRSRLTGFLSYSCYKDTRPWRKNFLAFLRSCLISAVYLALLPLNFIRGYHHYIDLLIRLNNHKAVIMTFLGLLKIDERDI